MMKSLNCIFNQQTQSIIWNLTHIHTNTPFAHLRANLFISLCLSLPLSVSVSISLSLSLSLSLCVRAKSLEATLSLADFSMDFDSIPRGKMKEKLLINGLAKETDTNIMRLHRKTNVKIRSPDGDIDFFDIVA